MRSLVFTTLAIFAVIEGGSRPSEAIQLADGIYFAQPPRLLSATTTFPNPGVWATYYFTLNLSAKAGEPLQRVTFTQEKGRERIRFDLKRSYAFARTPSESKQQLNLGEVTFDREKKMVSVTFDPPVPPGRTVTLGLRSVRNPLYGGVYLFGVTAFPAGEKSHGQFLGFGRLQFSAPSGGW